ncbi:hypothetical protein N9Z54_06040 [Planctomycetota bacterium]|nr:hypothetical protein [Planctomycetota bacterium]
MLVTSAALLLALVPGPVPVQIPGATVPPQITRATVRPAPDSLLPLVESVPEGGGAHLARDGRGVERLHPELQHGTGRWLPRVAGPPPARRLAPAPCDRPDV